MSRPRAAIGSPAPAMKSMPMPARSSGSIGVIAGGLRLRRGDQEARHRAARPHRGREQVDPRSVPVPRRPEDVERLKSLQLDVHEEFKTLVRYRRAGRLKARNADLFSGAFWSGRRALELGLIDGIGHMHQILRERYGDEVVLKLMERSQAAWWRPLQSVRRRAARGGRRGGRDTYPDEPVRSMMRVNLRERRR